MENIEEAGSIIRNASENSVLTEHSDVILVLGCTGSGKSTLTQFIGNQTSVLTAITVGSNRLIVGDTARISSGYSSHTIYPELVYDIDRKTAFYDCGGFNDNRSPAHDIACTFLIKRVIDHAERVKIILVVTYPSVQQGVERGTFMKLLEQAVTLIKDIPKFADSVALIVSKVYQTDEVDDILRHTPDDVIVSNVGAFLAKLKYDLQTSNIVAGHYLTDESRAMSVQLMDILSIKSNDVYQRIGIFRQPTKDGPIDQQNLMQLCKIQMLAMIHDNLRYTAKNMDDFGYIISDAAKTQIHHMITVLNTNFSDMSKFRVQFLKYLDDKVDRFKTSGKNLLQLCANVYDFLTPPFYANMMRYFAVLPDFIETITETCSPMQFYQMFMTKLAACGLETLQDSLAVQLQTAKYFDFLQMFSVTPLMADTFAWTHQLRLIQKDVADIKRLLKKKLIMTIGGAVLAAAPLVLTATPVVTIGAFVGGVAGFAMSDIEEIVSDTPIGVIVNLLAGGPDAMWNRAQIMSDLNESVNRRALQP